MVTKLPTDPGLVLFGATRRRLLAWLFGHPDESFYVRELLRLTGAPEGGAHRELAGLTAAGILTRTVRGKQVYFQANRASPVFPELLSLLTKTTGIVSVLRAALAPLAPRIRAAFVYGSAARNELRQGSDIDLLIVGQLSFEEVVAALRPVDATVGREVNPTVYPDDEYATKIRTGHHFLNSVRREPRLFVLGGTGELAELENERMADGPPANETGNRRSSGRHRTRPEEQRRSRPRP